MSESDPISKKNRWLFPQAWGICLLLLLAGTYRLWLTTPGFPGLPAIPLVQFGVQLPAIICPILSVVLVIGLLLVVAKPDRFGGLWWLVAGTLLLSFLTDQHRLQPWAYQSAIYAIVFATMDPPTARRWLIPLAASVYIYSAAGKFDFQFAHTVGQDFLSAAASPLGGLPESWSTSVRAKLALLMPATELLAGIGLLFRRTRRPAAVVVIVMHLSLLAILGPWGLNHSNGVVLWNVALIVQACLLMLWETNDEPTRWSTAVKSPLLARASTVTKVIVVAALILPLSERSGYWDHWPSWSLYSPHTSRCQIELHRSALEQLDEGLRTYAADDTDGDGWQSFQMERWSLEKRGVPVYPQARYQLALALEIATEYQLGDAIRGRVRGVSDRWTGRREERLLLNQREIEAELDKYWLVLSIEH